MDRLEDTVADESVAPAPDGAWARQWRQHRGSARGLISGVAIVAVLALMTFAVFTQLAQRRGAAADGELETWTRVLSGYSVSELVSAPSQPDVMYACASKPDPAGSVVNSSGGTYVNPPFSVLRSGDGGATWAATLTSAQLSGNCQITVSPSNSDDIYVESDPRIVSTDALVEPYLLHSTDGGRTSTRIDPVVFDVSGNSSAIVWSVEDLTQVGNRLFGLATVPELKNVPLPQPTPEPQYAFSLERLVMSSDGGHTWAVLDGVFESAELGVRSFAVESANPQIIYILVGRPVGPVMYQGQHPPALPAFPPQPSNVSGDLYKTATGGQQWTRVLADLPYGTTVRVSGTGSSTPLIYVGGSPSPTPLVASTAASAGNSTSAHAALTSGLGDFSLWTSADGGSRWRQAAPTPHQVYIDRWLVGPSGDVYVYQGGYFGGYGAGGSGSGSSGSATGSGTPVIIPPAGPATPATSVGGTAMPVTGAVQILSASTATATGTGTNTCYRYDPSTREWSMIAMPEKQGYLLAVNGSSNGQKVLWFMAEDNTQASLYRDVVS